MSKASKMTEQAFWTIQGPASFPLDHPGTSFISVSFGFPGGPPAVVGKQNDSSHAQEGSADPLSLMDVVSFLVDNMSVSSVIAP